MLFSDKGKREAQEKAIEEIKESVQKLSDRLQKIEELQAQFQDDIEKVKKLAKSSAKDIISIDTVLRTSIYSQNQLAKDVNDLFEIIKDLEGIESVVLYGFGTDGGDGYVN